MGDQAADENAGGLATDWIGRVVFCPRACIRAVVEWTIPECSLDGPSASQYPCTLFMCIVYLAFSSAVLVACVQGLMCQLHFSSSKIGLTLVALGCQVPDLLSSVAASRRWVADSCASLLLQVRLKSNVLVLVFLFCSGLGDMALSNAVGSQTISAYRGGISSRRKLRTPIAACSSNTSRGCHGDSHVSRHINWHWVAVDCLSLVPSCRSRHPAKFGAFEPRPPF